MQMPTNDLSIMTFPIECCYGNRAPLKDFEVLKCKNARLSNIQWEIWVRVREIETERKRFHFDNTDDLLAVFSSPLVRASYSICLAILCWLACLRAHKCWCCSLVAAFRACVCVVRSYLYTYIDHLILYVYNILHVYTETKVERARAFDFCTCYIFLYSSSSSGDSRCWFI